MAMLPRAAANTTWAVVIGATVIGHLGRVPTRPGVVSSCHDSVGTTSELRPIRWRLANRGPTRAKFRRRSSGVMMERHLATLWERVADAVPDATAVVHGEVRRSYRKL